MSRTNRKYEVRPLVCDWALDIPLGDMKAVLYFNSRNNAELVKDILEWEDAHPNEAIPYQPTLTPPNEPLTIKQLREMDGQPVYLIVDDGYEPSEMWALIDVPEKDHIVLINNIGGMSAYYSDDDLERDHITAYRRPPERQEDT